MFPPVLTAEGGQGWAARPGSRDDPFRPCWSRPKTLRGAPIARAHKSFALVGGKGSFEAIGSHCIPVRKVQIIKVSAIYGGSGMRMKWWLKYMGRGRKYVSTILQACYFVSRYCRTPSPAHGFESKLDLRFSGSDSFRRSVSFNREAFLSHDLLSIYIHIYLSFGFLGYIEVFLEIYGLCTLLGFYFGN